MIISISQIAYCNFVIRPKLEKYLNDKKYLVIIVSNQAAVGKSLINESDLTKIHMKMKLTI